MRQPTSILVAMLRRLVPLIFGLSLLLLGCNQTKLHHYPTLADQGILPLSNTDPFLGSNLFIAKESESSPILFNFLKTRGAPTAIEITSSDPIRVILYYPKDKVVYAADIIEVPIHRAGLQVGAERQWVIRGPYGIERKDYRFLAASSTAMVGEPIFFIRGQEFRFKQSPKSETVRVLQPVLPPMPTPRPKPRVISKPADPATGGSAHKEPAEPNVSDWSKLNLDQRGILLSQGFAERSDNGDVLHKVQGDGETIKAIAVWYTNSEKTADEIALLNGLKADEALVRGVKIRVPLKLLKRTKAMPIVGK